MSLLLDFVRNSIWHAFSTLTLEDGISVPKSKLKVLVASLGTILDCPGLCSALDDFGSSKTLTFPQFESYLTREVFTSLPDSMSRTELATYESRIDEACWIVSKSKLIAESIKRNPHLSKDSIYKLFRVFCLLADLVRDQDSDNTQVLLCSEEADLMLNRFVSNLGKDLDFLKNYYGDLFSNALFDFQTFVSVIELKFLKHFDKEEVDEVINELYEEFVDDIIKMGTLLKRGEYFNKYMEKMVILRSSGLSYYSDPKKMKLIEFDSQTRVEEADEYSSSKFHQFKLITPHRVLYLATLDKRYRSQWLAALRLALSRLHCQESYGRYLKDKRRLEWHRLRIRRQYETERTKEMLEAEKMARLAAEDQAKELAQQKAYEEEQRKQLEQMRLQLEKLLEEEIQAKKDEELVRGLQARVLNEEWEKREELERLQETQRKRLEVERHKSKTYLQKQEELERQLAEAQRKLQDLEKARVEVDGELRSARLKNAERNREILETRLKLFSCPIVKESGIHRARRSVSMREGRSAAIIQQMPNLPKIDFEPP